MKEKNPLLRRGMGDGTVPFEVAVPLFLNEENLVDVTPDHYGYWEVQDKAFSKLAGFHGILPNMDMLHRVLVRFFAARPDVHGNTLGRQVPGVQTWQPPIKLRER